MHELIEAYLDDHYSLIDRKYVIEEEPLGTGGAIKLACETCHTKTYWCLNGDTIFKINCGAQFAASARKRRVHAIVKTNDRF
jgi:D-glycero-alpha-D-manno-heptose 1-phosphate guanylyltransferase